VERTEVSRQGRRTIRELFKVEAGGRSEKHDGLTTLRGKKRFSEGVSLKRTRALHIEDGRTKNRLASKSLGKPAF